MRLGWSHGDQEIFTREEMIRDFTLEAITKSASGFNTKKLDWINAHYMKALPADEVGKELAWHLSRQGVSDLSKGPDPALVVKAYAERAHTLKEMAQKARCYYVDFEGYDPKAVKKWIKEGSVEILKAALGILKALQGWEAKPLDEALEKLAADKGVGMGAVGQPLRIALTGGAASPGIGDTLVLCGRERALSRIEKAITAFSKE